MSGNVSIIFACHFFNQLLDISIEDSCNLLFQSNLEYVSQPSTPAGGSRDDHGALSNGTSLSVFQTDTSISRQIEDIEPFMEQLIQGVGAQRGVSICQTLLSAIIEEDEVESFNYGNSKGEEYSHDAFEVEGDGTSQYSYMQSLITMQAGDRGPNGFKGDAGWRYHDELIREKPVSNGVLPEVATQYSQMCIDDRILLELSELGLYPEPVVCSLSLLVPALSYISSILQILYSIFFLY